MRRTTIAATTAVAGLLLAGCSSHHSAASGPVPSTTSAGASVSPASTGAASADASAGGTPTAGAPTSAASRTGSRTPVATPTTTAPTPTAKASPTTSDSTRCTNSQLTVSLGTPDLGAGQIYTQINFVNTGSATCTLAGHPGVSYVAGDDGHQVGSSATRTGTAITTVTLAPGKSASALLHETNYENFDPSACKPVTVRGLRVFPPGSTAAVFLPRAGKQCSSTTLPDPAMSIAIVMPS